MSGDSSQDSVFFITVLQGIPVWASVINALPSFSQRSLSIPLPRCETQDHIQDTAAQRFHFLWFWPYPSSLEDPPDYLCLGYDLAHAVSLHALTFNSKMLPTVMFRKAFVSLVTVTHTDTNHFSFLSFFKKKNDNIRQVMHFRKAHSIPTQSLSPHNPPSFPLPTTVEN